MRQQNLCSYQTDDETENDNILKTLASEYNRVTDVLAEKYKSSRRSLGKAIKATDDLEIIKSEIDYNMAEQYVALLNQEQQISNNLSRPNELVRRNHLI